VSDLLKTSLAIARSGWRATYNRTFRFSRMKSALIWFAVQALFFLFLARRAPAVSVASSREGLSSILALMGLQMAWFGIMYGFGRGQQQLYQGLLVPLFQITPARPLAFLVGRVIEAVPNRAWSCLLWAWVYSKLVPGSARWGAFGLLFAFGLVVGMIAHLAGLLLLSFWSRHSPKSMRNGLLLFGGVTLGMATWAAIFLAQGGTMAELVTAMRRFRQVALGAVLLLAGLPGLALLLALLVKPEAVEDLYRQGVYKVLELGEMESSRPGRSRWLPLGDGPIRAVLSREWLELSRSRVARVQLMIWLAGTVGVYFSGRAVAGAPSSRVVLFVGGLSLLTWFMAFGHWVVRVFEKERKTILLYRLAAVPTLRLLQAKFTSIFVPSAALVGLSTLVGGVAARLPAGQLVAVTGWSLLALAAGVLGGFGMAAATADEDPEEQSIDAAPAGGETPATGNTAWWALARTASLVVSAGLPIWTAAGQPGLPWHIPGALLWCVNLLLPLVLLGAGARLMIRSWERTGF
jgi:hypothetical protein